MKKYLLLTLLGLSYCEMLCSQNSIRGKIRDSETQEALVGVSIYLADLKTGATTDTNGLFVIRNVPRGSFLAEIRMLGYASLAIELTARRDIDWTEDSLIQIKLLRTPTEYHPVIITGVSGSTERLRNPVPTTLNTREHMLKHSSSNAISAIAELPGVSMISTGNAISKPVIRGLGYNRVVVLRNNIRQEGQQWGDEHGIEIDEFEIDRVEIIKGPGSIMYGSDAMAGVINFITPPSVPEGKIVAEFSSGFQSNGNLFGSSFMNQGNLNGTSWQCRFSQKIAGNYSTPLDGYVANTGFYELNASGYVGLNRKWGYSQISFSTFNQKLGLPEGERDSLGNFLIPFALNDSTIDFRSFTSTQLQGFDNSLGTPRQSINHHRIVLSNNLFFGKSQLKFDLGFQQNNRFEFGNVLAPSEAEIAMQLNTLTLNSVYFFPEKNGGQVTTGLNVQHQTNENSGLEFIIPNYTTSDFGAYIFARKYTGSWFVSAGLRGDFRSLQSQSLYLDSNGTAVDSSAFTITKFDEFGKHFISITGAAGVSYSTPSTVFRLNISRGFRSPNISELSSNGKHEGTFRYEIGNKELIPETSLQVDVGITFTSGHFNVELSGFYNTINNFIYLSKISSVFGGDSIADPTDPAPTYTFRQGQAALIGGELFTDLHPHPLDWLHFENSLSFVQGQLMGQPDSMKNLPLIPPLKYQSELNAHAEKQIGPFTNTYASVSIAHYFSQNNFYSAFGTETMTQGYTLMEAGTGADVVNKKGNVLMRIFFSVNNLLNTKYQSHLSRLKYAPVNPLNGKQGIYGQGRNFSLRIIFPLNWRK